MRPDTIPYSNRTTSKGAAESVRGVRPCLVEKVFLAIRKGRGRGKPGATCDEVELSLVASHQSTSSAIRTLALHGRILDSRKRRKTRTGRPAIVWKVVRA